MPGFLLSNRRTNIDLRRYGKVHSENKSYILKDGGGTVMANFLLKFQSDKVFKVTNCLFLILDGYLLNKRDLFIEYKVKCTEELIVELYKSHGENFFSVFRGCFSGALYDGEKSKWIVFTNQIGDAAIFYCNSNGRFAAGSQIGYVLDWCHEQNALLTFNESCAYQLLTYGYIADNSTFANEIKRLHGGDYLVWQNGELEVKTYHRFVKREEHFAGKSESEIIEAIDDAFTTAVQSEWEKDDEYGYRHLADLSGGLDSRMNIWVAHEQKERRATVLTYCKDGYLDEIIAREIASFWQDEFIFKPLDDVSFMYDIDENTAMLGGLSLYSGITGGKRLLESLDLSDYGIEHTGMVGDSALGSFYRTADDGDRKWPSGMYSEKLKDRLSDEVQHFDEAYDDYEIFLMYVRGFHGACNSHLIRRNYTEVGSPFLNVEFMQLCYDIPVALRIGHNIYKKWIIKKHPDAAKYIWEKTGGKITESPIKTNLRKVIKKGPSKIMKVIGRDSFINTGMNPIDYWLSTNEDLRNYLDSYKRDKLSKCSAYYSNRLQKDIDQLYESGNAMEKSMVLTVLSATGLYFGIE